MKNVKKLFCFYSTVVFSLSFTSATYGAVYTGTSTANNFSEQQTPTKKEILPEGSIELSNEELKSTKPVSFDEMRSFLRDWIKYKNWIRKEGKKYVAVAYLGVSNSSDYPIEVVKWMDAHGWGVDRFFLIERKFKMTLSVLDQQGKQDTFINYLQNQIKEIDSNGSLTKKQRSEMKKTIYGNMQNVRDATNMKAPVTPEEYEMIKMNKEVIMKIFQ